MINVKIIEELAKEANIIIYLNLIENEVGKNFLKDFAELVIQKNIEITNNKLAEDTIGLELDKSETSAKRIKR